MDRLLRPVAFEQCGCKVIERGMLRRNFGPNPKVARRGHQRLAKVIHPESIDKHAARQRIRRRDNRLRQLQTTAATTERLPLRTRGDKQELSGHFFPGSRRIAPHEHSRIVRLRVVGDDHRPGRRSGGCGLERVDLLPQFAFLVALGAIQNAFQVGPRKVDRPVLRNQRLRELPQVGGQFVLRFAVRARRRPRLQRLLEEFAIEARDLGTGQRRASGQRRLQPRIDLAILHAFRPRKQLVDDRPGQRGEIHAARLLIHSRQLEPRAEHRVRRTRFGLQIIPPALHKLRPKIVGLADEKRQLFQDDIGAIGELPGEIVGRVSPRQLGVFAPFRCLERFQFASQFRELGGIRLVGGVLAGRSDHRQLARFMAAREYSIQTVVVVGRDGVELVVMATSATDRQSQQPAADDIDFVVDVVVRVVELAAGGEEPEGRERFGRSVWPELIGRQLLEHEAVVWHVLIERANDVVAVGVSVGIAAFLRERVAFGIGIPRDIQPMAAPPFAIPRRRQQSINQPPRRVRGLVRDKRVNRVGVQRYAKQIERESASQRPSIRERGKFEPRRLQRQSDQRIERRRQPWVYSIQISDRGRDGRSRDRLIRPMRSAIHGSTLGGAQPSGRSRRCRPRHAHGNPTFKRLDLGGGKLLIGRHF